MRSLDLSGLSIADSAAAHLAALTARAAHAAAGLVYLADGEKLRLVGAYGLPDGWQPSGGLPPSRTIGALVLASGQPVIIEDVGDDERVPPNSPISDVGGRAYAGFQVRDAQGENIGVCAAMDYEPRRWSADELAGIDSAARLCSTFVSEFGARTECDRRRVYLDAMLDRLRVGVAGCDPDGRLVFANTALGRLGLDQHLHVRHRPDEPASAPLARALAGEVVRDVEIVLAAPDGDDRVLLADAEPLRSAGGEQLGAVLSVWDATRRRRAERYLDAERAVAEALVEAHSIEQAGPIVLRAVCRTLGWSSAELWLADEEADVLRPIATYRDDDRAGLRVPPQLSRGSGLAGTAWHRNQPVWIEDLDAPDALISAEGVGDSRLRSGVAIPVPNGGSTLGVLCFYTDVAADAGDTVAVLLSGIAGQVAQFLQRRRAEDAELALARSKDEYLFLVGHELRTPLTSIASYTELLAETPGLDPDAQRLLEVIDRNSSRLRHIIDELLDLAALDSGHADLVWEQIDVAGIAAAALRDTRTAAEEADVTLHARIEPGLTVEGDGERLRQVFDHLLRNAVSHSPGGSVTLSTAPVHTTEVEIAVADTGVGIPTDEDDQVFSPFYRTVLSREQQLPGAGLGLALSRAIVHAHRGVIRLTPNQPRGTRAVIQLPRAVAAP
ncbi:sensor histidine kinase [Cryptosporangium minutisporangium]|uniref:sensor histidine kinase n=1 Tax=Cryptosporangium minutisporangium TaxID=113569 RepID=UPI0031E9533C